jgi:hypothetical protein
MFWFRLLYRRCQKSQVWRRIERANILGDLLLDKYAKHLQSALARLAVSEAVASLTSRAVYGIKEAQSVSASIITAIRSAVTRKRKEEETCTREKAPVVNTEPIWRARGREWRAWNPLRACTAAGGREPLGENRLILWTETFETICICIRLLNCCVC